MTLCMIMVVTTGCILMGNWIFDNNDTTMKTEEQVRFELWLLIELYLIYSYVTGAALFALVSKLKKPVLSITSVFLSGEGHSDFMEYYNLQIDFSNTMFVPANTSIFLALLSEFPVYIEVTGYLGLLQTFIFFAALFPTRASEVRSKFYLEVMPEVCYTTAATSRASDSTSSLS